MQAKKVIDLFEHVNGTAFVSLTTHTRPRLDGGKANVLQGHITKETHGIQVMVFQQPAFERLVQRRLEAEGFPSDAYIVGPRKWGVRQTNLPIVLHDGKTYLEVFVLRPGTAIYKCKGRPIAEDNVYGLPLERDVGTAIRCFNVEGIRSITINGKTYLA